MQIDPDILPEIVNNFTVQAVSTKEFNELIGIGIDDVVPVFYRCGDQPNNAFALGVEKEGEVAAAGGTSGVIYALSKN